MAAVVVVAAALIRADPRPRAARQASNASRARGMPPAALFLAKPRARSQWELPCVAVREDSDSVIRERLERLFADEFGLGGISLVSRILDKQRMEDWKTDRINDSGNFVDAEMQIWQVQLAGPAVVDISAGEPYTRGGVYESVLWAPVKEAESLDLRPTHNRYVSDIVRYFWGDFAWQLAVAAGD